jgi:hypothetical protein
MTTTIPAFALERVEVVLTPAVLLALLVVLVLAVLRWRGRDRRITPTSPGTTVVPPVGLLGLDVPYESPAEWRWRGRRGVGFVAVVAALIMAGFFAILWSGGPRAGAPVWVELARPSSVAPAVRAETDLADEAWRVTAVDAETGLQLIAWSGGGQLGVAGQPLRRALAVVVRDSADRPVPGFEVRFTAARGGGQIEPSMATTNDLGLATTVWSLGADPDSLRVTAHLPDPPGLHVRFEAMLSQDPTRRAAPDPDVAGSPASLAPVTVSEPPGTAAPDTAPDTASPATEDASPVPARPRLAFSAGGVQTCQAAAGGGVTCWGGDEQGSGMVARATPADAPPLRAVSAGVFHSCGLSSRGTVYCWPVRATGLRTLAAAGVELELPGGAPAVDVAAGSEHSCALASDGAVYCWGSNPHGQVGNRTTSDARSPVRVQGLPAVTQLATGWLHTCALTAAGRAYCWGANGRGQIGDGGAEDRNLATALDHPEAFVLLTGGSAHTCGVTRAGRAWCWGSNEHGQLGTGAGDGQRRPQQVAGSHVFRALAAGGVHTCGLTVDGLALCWGRNTFGQLGNGRTENSPVPTPVIGGPPLVALSAGGAHTCGATESGRVYCWGNNVQGQVGDGTRENRSTPVPALQAESS